MCVRADTVVGREYLARPASDGPSSAGRSGVCAASRGSGASIDPGRAEANDTFSRLIAILQWVRTLVVTPMQFSSLTTYITVAKNMMTVNPPSPSNPAGAREVPRYEVLADQSGKTAETARGKVTDIRLYTRRTHTEVSRYLGTQVRRCINRRRRDEAWLGRTGSGGWWRWWEVKQEAGMFALLGASFQGAFVCDHGHKASKGRKKFVGCDRHAVRSSRQWIAGQKVPRPLLGLLHGRPTGRASARVGT